MKQCPLSPSSWKRSVSLFPLPGRFVATNLRCEEQHCTPWVDQWVLHIFSHSKLRNIRRQIVENSAMSKQIHDFILSRGGPISLADFMTEVRAIQHPNVNKELLEVPLIDLERKRLGNVLGGFVLQWWEFRAKPKRLNLVHLGPGIGTVIAQLIRSTAHHREFSRSLHIHFIESSQTRRTMQHIALREDKVVPISFHMELQDVPRGVPCIIIAHDCFKGLPIRQFESIDSWDWREKLVDISNSDDQHFRFVLDPTATSTDFVQRRLNWASLEETQKFRTRALKNIELCPEAWELTREIVRRINEDKGVAFINDIGEDKIITDSLQARNLEDGQYVDVLEDPGSADLTATVDFAAIKRVAEDAGEVGVYGPILQTSFANNFGLRLGIGSWTIPNRMQSSRKVMCFVERLSLEEIWIASSLN